MALIMSRWGFSEDGKKAQWRIGTEDGSDVRFPSNSHLRTLFRKHTHCGDTLSVVSRASNIILIEAPEHLTEKDRLAFLSVLWMETVFM
jgi:hypothetical protein